GDFRRFAAKVGLQRADTRTGDRVVFRVYGDGRLLHETAPLGQADKALSLDVDVDGVQVMELVAASVNGTPGALPPAIVWGAARLRSHAAPVVPTHGRHRLPHGRPRIRSTPLSPSM